ncbi:protein kinase, ArgK family, putative [Geobacter metallireducens GS-15]|uniref:Protein kinase, ArgK family, putative n=1 Tax=Geobacter metallireducens (strain ATCC 53774 / DSM 7210 / GS-15) TaxID=269799 RepID=Q39TI7_GEOMG|nr:methylmalonyl Co-A mutase-associated GTPase MeaB [Geobacter metallireducens]ABB32437.1 protein kinase, ArgK family, putative [Geobacter metallireducens GS-15]
MKTLDRSISRLISLLERRNPEGIEELKGLYCKCGRAHVIGITGPPGAGKSCLVAALVREIRRRGKTVGVLAVDPSSPFSDGAILGDRARMTEFSGDNGVFIRSFSARGASGGLAPVINDAVDVLDAFGKEVIIVETVGVGQVEMDIAKIAHTVVLTLVPGYGDSLQAMKAGILEIGDILVVNKSDQPGADGAVNDLSFEMPVTYGGKEFQCANIKADQWGVPIAKVSALKGDGVEDLVTVIFEHLMFITERNIFTGICQKRRSRQFLDILTQQVRDRFLETLKTDRDLQKWINKIENLKLDPYSASEQVVDLVEKARILADNGTTPRNNR